MHQRPALNEVVITLEITQITLKKVREMENDIRLAFIIFFALAGNILPTPLRSSYPEESRRRDRSQTAPEPERGSASLHRTALKRNAMSEAQLDALQHAYAVVADTDGVSQIAVQDLMQARRLANRINQVLDEQMCKKLVPGGEPSRSGNS